MGGLIVGAACGVLLGIFCICAFYFPDDTRKA